MSVSRTPPSSTTHHPELHLPAVLSANAPTPHPSHSPPPPASLSQKHNTKQKTTTQTNQKNTNNTNSDLALRGLQLTPGTLLIHTLPPPPATWGSRVTSPSPGSCLPNRATGKAFLSKPAGARSWKGVSGELGPPGPAPLTSATTALHWQLLPAAFCWLLLPPTCLVLRASGHKCKCSWRSRTDPGSKLCRCDGGG